MFSAVFTLVTRLSSQWSIMCERSKNILCQTLYTLYNTYVSNDHGRIQGFSHGMLEGSQLNVDMVIDKHQELLHFSSSLFLF